jgi:hypothetical protein
MQNLPTSTTSKTSPSRASFPRRRRYHPEELTELYLGLAIDAKDKEDILAKARTLNPNINVFLAKRGSDGKLAFAKA